MEYIRDNDTLKKVETIQKEESYDIPQLLTEKSNIEDRLSEIQSIIDEWIKQGGDLKSFE